MSSDTWALWELIFSLFLFFTSIFGYFSVAYIVFIKNTSSIVSRVVRPIWIILPILFLFSFILKDIVSSSRENYIIVLSVCILIFCSSAALGANILEKKLEEKSLVTSKSMLIVLRTFVLIFSSITIACSIGAVRASAYHMNLANYSYSQDLATYISSKREKEIESSENRYVNCDVVLSRLKKYNSEFFIQSRFPGFIFRTKDIVQKVGDFDYSIEFEDRPASGRIPIDVNILTFENESGIACHINIPLNSRKYFDSKTIHSDKLGEFVNIELERKSSIIDSVDRKPSSVIPYALASSYEILGGQSLKVEALDDFAKTLNFITLWFFNILTGIVFYLVLRNPDNKT